MEMIKRGSVIKFGNRTFTVVKDFNALMARQELSNLKELMTMEDFLIKEQVLLPTKEADFIYDELIGFTQIGGNNA